MKTLKDIRGNMRYLAILLLMIPALLLADPPNAGPGWRSTKQQIIDQWDQMSPGKQLELLAIEYNQSAPGWWATMDQNERMAVIQAEQKALNQMTKDQRSAFMNLSPKERQDTLYRAQQNKQPPGPASTQSQQQQTYDRYNYTPPPVPQQNPDYNPYSPQQDSGVPAVPQNQIPGTVPNSQVPGYPATPGPQQPILPGQVQPGVQQPNYVPPPTQAWPNNSQPAPAPQTTRPQGAPSPMNPQN
ncbi:MAG: hypothetical protein JHC93_04950 [Parachlamydiales bacterium]|nr:hypothetical protein [Parachlamydiales bacterium]